MDNKVAELITSNYRLSVRLAVTLQRLIVVALSILALLAICAFAIGAYGLFVMSNYLLAISWFGITVLLLLGLRKLARSSQALTDEIANYIIAFTRDLADLKDDKIKKLELEAAQLNKLKKNA